MERRLDRQRKKNGPKRFTTKMQSTLLMFFCGIIVCVIILIIRITNLNSKSGERYSKKVLSQQTFISSTIPYRRGDIVDRNHTILATSVKVYNLILDIKLLNQYEECITPTLEAIQTYFELSMDELLTIMEEKKDSSYVILKKEVDSELYDTFKDYMSVKENQVKGVWFEEEYKRIYPNDNLASMIVGFTYSGDVGAYGIEKQYQDELIGTNGLSYGYFNSELNLERVNKSAINGNTLVTTIDATVQKHIEEKIQKFEEEYPTKKASVLVMNPNDGSIYAMATNTQYNLNDPRNLNDFYLEQEQNAMSEEEQLDALYDIWRNSIITDVYEPGSTFKPFTVAAALEEDVINTNYTFYCDGFEVIDGTRIKCNHTHHDLTLTEVIMQSCNDALMDIGLRLKVANFHKYLDSFLFGSKTNIDLPGEGTGLVLKEESMKNVDLAASSFGQTNEVTMIQLACAFSSVVNGGYYYEPHVMKQIESESGTIVEKNDGVLVRRTISSETSDFMKAALYETVESGTAKHAKVEGYAIGGKTGTAQKQPRSADKFVLSFIGAVPINDPEVVIYVTLDEVEGQRYKDSTLATSFAGEILSDILPFLGVYPEGEIDYSIWGVDPEILTDEEHFQYDENDPGEVDYLESEESSAIQSDEENGQQEEKEDNDSMN